MERGVRTFSPDKALVEERRRQIVRCASQLFIKKGYEYTGMRELAKSFGKSTGSLYHYVGSKEDILYLILDYTMADQNAYLKRMREQIKGLSPTQALIESIRIYLQDFEELADMYIFLNHMMVILGRDERRMMLGASRRATEYFENLLIQGIEAGEFQIRNPKMVAHDIVVLGNSLASRRWFWKRYFTLGEYIKEQTELVLRMIGAEHHQDALPERISSASQP